MGPVANRAFSDRALRAAWADVAANDRADGQLSAAIARFEDSLDDELTRLVADLAWGTYQPRPLFEVVITEPDRTRALQVPTVHDRVVERALLAALTPLVDPVLSPAAYGYRPGLGVTDAVQAVASIRQDGSPWVVRADVDECFPSIPVHLARRMLAALVEDAEVLDVIEALLARPCRTQQGRLRPVRGLPQGCALSPMLANLVLSQVDQVVLSAGYSLVRYADDILIGAASRDEAWEAARTLSHAVEELGMSLGSETTAVMSFEEGFAFLGEDFGPRYPPLLTDARVEEPDRKVVYVAVQGGRVRKKEGRLLVQTADEITVLDVPTSHVRRLVCFGAVGVSAGARSWAMATGVEVVFASRRGTLLGYLTPANGGPRADRLRRQVCVQGTTAALTIGAAIIEAKIRKQIVVLQRFGRRADVDTTADAIRQMRAVLAMLPDASSRDELMGLEGAAAASYFPALGQLMPPPLQFRNRSRQPPLDVANAALSFLYTILLGECVTALLAAGLDPAVGVLHADHERRPSLALDLLEEFRPLIVDQTVLASARLNALKPTHARVEEGRTGVLLTKAGREAILDGYERRMLTITRGALPDFSGTLRRHIYRQAQRLQAAISDPSQTWRGLSWR